MATLPSAHEPNAYAERAGARPPVFHVRGVDVRARTVGRGHPSTMLELQTEDGQVMDFALCDVHLQQATEKLLALCAARGVAIDPTYRPLETVSYANGHDRGHAKQLPVLPLRESDSRNASPAFRFEEEREMEAQPPCPRAEEEDAGESAPPKPPLMATASFAAQQQRDAELFAEAWRRYSTGETVLWDCAGPLEISPYLLRQKFKRHFGAAADRAAALWFKHHKRPRFERMQLFAAAASSAA